MIKYAIVMDFDGTITTRDIGNSLCLHFKTTTQAEIEQAYATHADASDWMRHHFSQMTSGPEVFEAALLSYAQIRSGFVDFVNFCKAQAIPLEIASGGLDIYIKPILKSFSVPQLPILSVKGRHTQNGIVVDFSQYNGLSLDDFKKARVLYYKNHGYTTLFFGDGPADLKAAQVADIVFADSYLAGLCAKNKIAFKELDFNLALNILKGVN